MSIKTENSKTARRVAVGWLQMARARELEGRTCRPGRRGRVARANRQLAGASATASLSFLKLHVRHARFETKMSAIRKGEAVELFFFARFHASPGRESALQEALKEVVVPSREEAGCLSIHAFRSNSDPRLFFIHSRWKHEAAFDYHGSLPHTLRFLERATQLIDHPLDLTRTTLIA
jgi:quinol monooxygenase YgiN